jgi:tRNA(Ile)-lysidine synthetase-like protein
MFKVKNHLYLSLAYDQSCLIDIRDFVSYSVEIKQGERLIKLKHIELDLSGDVSRFNIKQSSYPLTIRTAQSGDMYQVGAYAKKVSRLFIDMKMPKHVRLIWPLIVDVDGTIIYIPRYRAGFKKEDGAKLSVLW